MNKISMAAHSTIGNSIGGVVELFFNASAVVFKIFLVILAEEMMMRGALRISAMLRSIIILIPMVTAGRIVLNDINTRILANSRTIDISMIQINY